MATNINNFDKAGNLGLDNGAGIISNLEVGGQLGYGIKAGAFDAATPLVLPPAVIYVTQTPHMWDMYEQDQALARVVKSMFETHAKSVTGIDVGYTLESGQQPVGHDGQQMDAPTVSKRNAVQPNFTFGEITGNLVFRCIQTWIWDIADPDTQISMARLETDMLIPFTMSAYALSFIVLQFDQTMDHNRLLGAQYITNVYPTATNEFGMKREIGQAAVQDRSISFTGLGIENAYIYKLGQRVAAMLAYRDGYASEMADPYASTSQVSDGATLGQNTSIANFGDVGIADETPAGGGSHLADNVGAGYANKTPVGPSGV